MALGVLPLLLEMRMGIPASANRTMIRQAPPQLAIITN